jgi:hypothetical protein
MTISGVLAACAALITVFVIKNTIMEILKSNSEYRHHSATMMRHSGEILIIFASGDLNSTLEYDVGGNSKILMYNN